MTGWNFVLLVRAFARIARVVLVIGLFLLRNTGIWVIKGRDVFFVEGLGPDHVWRLSGFDHFESLII